VTKQIVSADCERGRMTHFALLSWNSFCSPKFILFYLPFFNRVGIYRKYWPSSDLHARD
jgi:hypothetical protein